MIKQYDDDDNINSELNFSVFEISKLKIYLKVILPMSN